VKVCTDHEKHPIANDGDIIHGTELLRLVSFIHATYSDRVAPGI
jgi:hypothetical protein